MIVCLALIVKLSTMHGMKERLNQAINAAGGLSAFVAVTGAPSVHAVKAWLRSRVPAEHCPSIERATGVLCEELRPDVEWSVLRKKRRSAQSCSSIAATEKEASHG